MNTKIIFKGISALILSSVIMTGAFLLIMWLINVNLELSNSWMFIVALSIGLGTSVSIMITAKMQKDQRDITAKMKERIDQLESAN